MDGHRLIQEHWNCVEQRAGDETKPLGLLPDALSDESPLDPWPSHLSLVERGTERLVLPTLKPRRTYRRTG